MNYLVFPVFLLPLVLAKIPFNLKSDPFYPEPSEAKLLVEILELNSLTQEEADEYLSSVPITEITEDNVSFYISNRDNVEPVVAHLSDVQNLTSVSPFNLNLETVVTIHGWQNTYNSTFNDLVGIGYLNISDVNIVAVDWDTYANGLYLPARFSVPYIGQYVAQFINNISVAYNYSLENFSLVGHSLGAHISGYAGQLTNGSLSSITGLDPAGPLFFRNRPAERLSEGDAQYVQAIHTSALLIGVHYPVGDADYWPNGGYFQPGCLNVSLSCSHGRSYHYFAEALSTDQFIAKNCDSYNDYKAGECRNVPPTVMGGGIVNKTLFGNYYLKTGSEYPYALGETDL